MARLPRPLAVVLLLACGYGIYQLAYAANVALAVLLVTQFAPPFVLLCLLPLPIAALLGKLAALLVRRLNRTAPHAPPETRGVGRAIATTLCGVGAGGIALAAGVVALVRHL